MVIATLAGDPIFGRLWVGMLKKGCWKSSELIIIFLEGFLGDPKVCIWKGFIQGIL